MKSNKTYIYVDGFNLYYGAVRNTPYKWLDIGKLCHILLPSDQIISIKYFTATVSGRPGDPDEPIRQQLYLRALKTTPNLEIIYGHFLTHSVPMRLSGSNPPKWVKVDKTEEKGSDVISQRTCCTMALEGLTTWLSLLATIPI